MKWSDLGGMAIDAIFVLAFCWGLYKIGETVLSVLNGMLGG